MKVAAIFDVRDGGLVDRPDPIPGGNFVVVKVQVAPMCTEYGAYKNGGKGDCLGHEAAGVVHGVAQKCRVKSGDRVVVQPQYGCGACPLCLGGDHIHCQFPKDPYGETGSTTGKATYAQYLLKEDWLLTKIPDDISTEHASMACCGLGPTYGALQGMKPAAGEVILITGLGPVGMGAILNARYRNLRVIAVEPNAWRAKLAMELGAELVLDPRDPDTAAKISSATGGRGVDLAIECSGVGASQRLVVDAVRRRGQVSFVGWGGEVALKIPPDMILKGLRLHGAWHYNLADAGALMDQIRRMPKELDRLITHRFPMSRVKEAWELQVGGECGKVVLDPWG